MNNRATVLGAAIFFSLCCTSASRSNTYFIKQYDLTDGFYHHYTVVTGFIETDGTLGLLSAANIINYEILVADNDLLAGGDLAFVFHPRNPLAGHEVLGYLVATETAINVVVDKDPTPLDNIIRFYASDNSHPGCIDSCMQSLVYSNVLQELSGNDRRYAEVNYEYRDRGDFYPLSGGVFSAPFSDALTLAEVPESSTLTLMLFTLLIVIRRDR